MSYLQITNDGVCDPVGFTTLGVSTSRDNEENIGQFGSGNKLSALVLLRNNINPIIYCGDTKIEFFTRASTIKHSNGEKKFDQVYVKIGNVTERTSMSLGFGELDWTDVKYAIREYISNALDQSGQDKSKIRIEIVEKIIPHSNKTVVGIPLTSEVYNYYEDLEKHFLHFSLVASHTDRILTKTKTGPARIYRKGVYIKTIDSKLPSLFDYNFGNDLKIDESRSLDSYSCEIDVADDLKQSEKIGEIFEALVYGTQCWETQFTNWRIESVNESSTKDLWQYQWKRNFGNAIIAMDQQGPLANSAKQKGYTVHIIKSINWYKGLSSAGIPTVIDVLDNVNDKGHQILEPTQHATITLDKVWEWVEAIKLTRNKIKPTLKCFRAVQTDDSIVMGYVKDDIIYINEDNDNSKQTHLEEIAHYITGASDNTRAFQSYAFQISVAIAEHAKLTEKINVL